MDQSTLLQYFNLAKLVKSDKARIAFFDQNEEAFSLDPSLLDEFENCKHSFCAEKGFKYEDLDEIHSNSWESLPEDFKIYAFEYCIITGSAYEDIQDTISVDEITSLIKLELLSEMIEDEGLMISEAEDEVMLILEKRVKEIGRNATEDDLYDATQKILVNLRDYMDDNHPHNLNAA